MPEKWPGVGARIAQRILELGYRQPTGKPDVRAFCKDHPDFLTNQIYKYMSDSTTPDRRILLRLADHLKVHAAWLLFGDDPWVQPAKKVVAMALLTLNLLWSGGVAPATASTESLLSEVRRRRIRRPWGLSLKGVPRLVHRAALG